MDCDERRRRIKTSLAPISLLGLAMLVIADSEVDAIAGASGTFRDDGTEEVIFPGAVGGQEWERG